VEILRRINSSAFIRVRRPIYSRRYRFVAFLRHVSFFWTTRPLGGRQLRRAVQFKCYIVARAVTFISHTYTRAEGRNDRGEIIFRKSLEKHDFFETKKYNNDKRVPVSVNGPAVRVTRANFRPLDGNSVGLGSLLRTGTSPF